MKTIVTTIPDNTIMKRTSFFFFLFLLFFALQSKAQIAVSININSAPSRVYEPLRRHVHTNYCHHEDLVDYYYYPEIEVYFDVHAGLYLYYASNGWVRSRYLPSYCDDYNINRGYRVQLDYHGQRPYTHYHEHKVKYKCKGYKKEYKHKKHKKNRYDD